MSGLARLLAALVLLAVLLACVFGWLATREPMDEGVRWTWRAVYGGVGLLALVLLVRLSWRRR